MPTDDAGRGCGSRVTCGPGGAGNTFTTYGYRGNQPTALGTGCTVGAPVATAAAAPVITPAMIYSAFRSIPLPDSELVVQPPGGETLVNFDTIFSTAAETESATVSLLGQTLEFEAFPASYAWRHGDGSTQTTDWPGREYAEGVPMEQFIVTATSTPTSAWSPASTPRGRGDTGSTMGRGCRWRAR